MKRSLASVFLLAFAAAVLCLGAGSASAATKVIDITGMTPTEQISTTNTTKYLYKVTAAQDGTDILFKGVKDVGAGNVGILVDGGGTPTKFTITFEDGFNITSRATAFQVYNGANVDMIIKGTVTFTTRTSSAPGNDAMLHCGATQQWENGDNTVRSIASELHIIGADPDRSKNVLIIDENNPNPGIDAIRAADYDTSVNNILSFKDLTISAIGMKPGNRGICGDTSSEVIFNNCALKIHGGIPIAGGIDGVGHTGRSDMHFINCALDLKCTNTGANVGAVNILGDHRVIFCDSQDNIAIVHAEGGGHAVVAGIVDIAGGAVKLTRSEDVTTARGIKASHVNIIPSDKDGHPKDKDQGSIIFYVDKADIGDGLVHVGSGVDAIISGKNDAVVTPAATATRTEWEAKDTTSDPSKKYTVGNVVGDFELFDTNITPGKPFQPDYVIHDGEVIIVDENSSLTIHDKTKFVIEGDGHLVLIGKDNVNDGVIEVSGKTDEQLKELIKEWGFKGTGTIVNKGSGTVFNNAGETWGDIVNNSDQAKKDKLDGKPNLVVFGKDDAGKTNLAAVNPEISDDAYLLPANQTLDLRLYVTDPADSTKLSNALDPDLSDPDHPKYHFLTSAIWPLKADGTYVQPDDTLTKIPGTQTPVVAIQNGTASFPYTQEQIAELRKWAKDNDMDSFVIWVYETDGTDKTDYNGGYKRPFVFRMDTPEHTLAEIVQDKPEVKEQIVQGPNTLVFDMLAQSGSVATPEFVEINPTRPHDQASMHEVQIGNGLALDVYIAKNAKDVPIDKASEYEGMNVAAGLRPYDGLSIEQYRGLGDFVLKKGPHAIAGGYAEFSFDPTELSRWARRHKISEFVIYVYNTDEHGSMRADKISQEFVFRIAGVDTDAHGTHCSGCDAGMGAGLAGAAALAFIASRRKRGR